jgi:hypothetical protein
MGNRIATTALSSKPSSMSSTRARCQTGPAPRDGSDDDPEAVLAGTAGSSRRGQSEARFHSPCKCCRIPSLRLLVRPSDQVAGRTSPARRDP